MPRWGIITFALGAILVAGGALFAVFLLTPETKVVSNQGAGPSVETMAPALLPGSSGKLSAWVFNGSIPEAVWRRIIGEFQKSSGYLVHLTVFESEAKYREALRQAMATHTLPDTFLIDATESEAMRQAGHLAFMDVNETEWVGGALAAFRRGDKTLAFPSEFSLLALYYNPALFDRVGVAYPDVHWTWEILLGISQALYQAPRGEQKEPTYAMELPWRFALWEAFAMQVGGGLYRESGWLAGDSKVVAAQIRSLTFLRDYVRNYIIVARPVAANSGPLFLQGRAAMTIAGTELMRDLRQNRNLRWGVAPLPKGDTRATVLTARGWAVSSLSVKPKDAARLARALACQPSRSDWLSALAPAPGEAKPAAEMAFYESASYAQPPLVTVTAPEIERMMDEELLRWIVQKEPSPEALIDWAQKMFKP